ncbi:MAG: ethanolamine ammonia-lyase subunit EutC [Vitreoscilla sp.]|nr:ethanolamine ammonia-lyase subunit EutC [Vitreoscilla sp.]
MKPAAASDPWVGLRRHTPARIALGHCGISLPTGAHLDFQMAHAQARDAVHRPFDVPGTAAAIEGLGLTTLRAHSAAPDRPTYLQRPDLGRRLDEPSAQALRARQSSERCDLGLVVADGLSSLAVERHATSFLAALLDLLRTDSPEWRLSPVVMVHQGRVAVGDDIGELLRADLVLVMIGERPGLSSPDSMGLYLTWAPRPGRSDAERNCISNVRPEGQNYPEAARRSAYLLRAARTRQITGVALKDDSTPPARLDTSSPAFALTGPDR